LFAPPPPPVAVIDPNTELLPRDAPPGPAGLLGSAADPKPPAPTVTVYDPGDVDTGNADPVKGVASSVCTPGTFVLKPPAPPPPPDCCPPPPPPATTRYSTVSPKLPGSVTLKVPVEVKMCAL
jgi:hypothetical protein